MSNRSILFRCAFRVVGFWCVGFGTMAAMGDERPSGSGPDPQSLLQAYEKSLAPYERIKGKWRLTRPSHAEEIQRGGKNAVDYVGEVSEHFVARDGTCLRTLTTRTDGAKNSPWDAERVVEEGKTSSIVYPDGDVLGRLKVSRQDFLSALYSSATASFGFGIVHAGLSAPEFLRASQRTAEADVLDGHPVDVLCGTTDTIQIKVWLDPALDHTPRRLLCVLKKPYRNTADREYSPELLAMEPPQQTSEYVVKSFRDVGGRQVPEKITVTFTSSASPMLDSTVKTVDEKQVFEIATRHDEQGNIAMTPAGTSSWDLELLEIAFDPEFTDADFRISQTIPNGTRVSMQDAPQQTYIWQDGQMVKGAEATTPPAGFVAEAGKDLSSSRQRWIAGGGAAFLLAVAVAAFCYRRGARKPRN